MTHYKCRKTAKLGTTGTKKGRDDGDTEYVVCSFHYFMYFDALLNALLDALLNALLNALLHSLFHALFRALFHALFHAWFHAEGKLRPVPVTRMREKKGNIW
jgi:hypothetical protein